MPELPEVETIRRALDQELLGLTLRELHVKERVHLLKNCTSKELQQALVGCPLKALGRRGKFLIFDFGGYSMILHLRMSGRLLFEPARHTRLTLHFAKKRLYLDDARRFAMLYLANTKHLDEFEPLSKLGVEPFSSGYTLEVFLKLLQTKREIKRVLLDQNRLAGLGNIYANEALFEAGIHPQRPASSLSFVEAGKLFEAIPCVLERAIAAGGTSIDSYRTPQGEPGRFQDEFRIYACQGLPCHHCGTPIERIPQGGRSSYFCPRCQPLRNISEG